MPLTAGDRLGPYEIISLIGQGGMGEVYQARDTRLDRLVAIKVSKTEFSERFDREARAVAALNHPNICTLYDVGPNYLVMEFVDGEAPQGPLPFEEALRIARQICDALEAAHEKNIVHRDLKPGNIKITPAGTVKVLDFGLAKLDNAPAVQSENSPTLSMAATRAGVILGTAGYMAPEQARGKSVDKRADIWAFGVVFHELLTGKRVFQGEDVTDTLAKVIQAEPKLDDVPANVQRLLRGCLEKDPAKRLRDIGDVWRLMDSGAEAPSGLKPAPRRAWIAAALATAIAAALGWGWWRASQPVEHPLIRLDVDLGSDVSLPPTNNSPGAVTISPDGTRLVYISGTPRRLFLRRLDQPKSTPLPGTDNASSPFFSPDGQWIGFVARNKLSKISVDGGAVVPVADQTITAGFSWGDDGNIVAGGAFNGGVRRIPSGGGAPVVITELVNGELAHALPQFLPGNKNVLFASYAALDADKASIDVVSVADHKRKTVVRGGTTPWYVAAPGGSGYLIYNNKATLFAIPFDPDRLETRGTAVPILDDLAFVSSSTGVATYSLSQTGTLVYRKGTAGVSSAASTIKWVDPMGKKSPLRENPGDYQAIRFSPDGARLALAVNDGSSQDIWSYEPARDSMTRLTFGGAIYDAPAWSPDGRYVVFASIGNGLFWTRADGAGQPQPLTQSKTVQIPVSFSPDGKRLGYFELASAPQMWTLPLEDEGGRLKAGKPEQFLKTQFNDQGPIFSLDGHWVAYQSNESGKPEVYVRAFPQPSTGQGGKWQISNDGGTSPVWSRNGRELFYRSGDKIMKANYTAKGDSFVNEKPGLWIDKLGGATVWDLAPDGKRVAEILPVDTPETPKQDHEVVILFNFLDELRRKVPTGK